MRKDRVISTKLAANDVYEARTTVAGGPLDSHSGRSGS